MPEYLIKTRDEDYWIGSVSAGDPPEQSLQLVQAERRWDWNPEGGPMKLAGTNLFLDLPQQGDPLSNALELTEGHQGDGQHWIWENDEDGGGRIRADGGQGTFITALGDFLHLMADGGPAGAQQRWTLSRAATRTM